MRTHRSRGIDIMETCFALVSYRTRINVSERIPGFASSVPTVAKSLSLGSALARESEPTSRKFSTPSLGGDNAGVAAGTRRTESRCELVARTIPSAPASDITMATLTTIIHRGDPASRENFPSVSTRPR